MHWPGFAKAACLAAIAATVLASSSGCVCCRPQYGLILRGDWSLEMNRVPWLGSRTQSYEEDSLGGCEPTASCGPMEPAPGLGGPVVPTSCDATAACRPGACGTCGRLGGRLFGPWFLARQGPPVQPASYDSFPKFHPVPTQPAFTRSDMVVYAEPAGAATALNPGENAPLPPAVPKAPEAIPTPQGRPTLQPSASNSHAGPAAQAGSWVFLPSGQPTEKSQDGWRPKVASSRVRRVER